MSKTRSEYCLSLYKSLKIVTPRPLKLKIGTSKDVKLTVRYNLQVNVDKTEYTILDRNENSWKNTKKVGTLIGDTEDVQRRKQLSTAALAKSQNVWVRGDKLKKKTKLKLYRALKLQLFYVGTNTS